MSEFLRSGFFLGLVVAASASAQATPDSADRIRITQSFDQDWRFLKADIQGAEKPEFDDSTWRMLNVPHDWSIEGPIEQNNPTGGDGGFFPAGVGWYRKQFSLPTEYANKRCFIEFDGVMANSDVWINGHHLGKRPNGYVSFCYELTEHLKYGKNRLNVICVRADNSSQPASRWYTGAGIYRHVRLITTAPVHIDHYTTFVSTPKVDADQAVIQVQTTVVNQSATACDTVVKFIAIGPDNQIVQTAATPEQTVPAGKSANFSQELVVKNPSLWDIDRPNLYRMVVKIRSGDDWLDDDITTFGIREFKFEADTGFWLNGKNIKIKGVCLHHDCGALGAAVPLRAWQRRLETLKQIGVNGIRTAHNPVAPEFLDLCDRMGFLVMDEFFDCWMARKRPYDYHLFFEEWSKIDARDTIRRDRNHPSIILYSVGNEIRDTQKSASAKEILKGLVEVCHENDPTRPVTQGLFRPNVSHDYDNGLADMLDVIGTNYRVDELLAAHQAKPTRKIIGTEQGHDLRIWLNLRDNPPMAGHFLWTGIDYLGESRRWPRIIAGSGLLDISGVAKPMAFQRQSWWNEKPMVYLARRIEAARSTPSDPGFEPLDRPQTLFTDWNPQNSETHKENVEVYSNCEDVELFLNGKSLGSLPKKADDSPRNWEVEYAPGTLKAVAKNGGREVAACELHTAGKPAKIMLAPDREKIMADWDDVCYVAATVTDEKGMVCAQAEDLIDFKIDGPGVIAAVENANRSSHEPFQASQRKAYQGRCMAIIKATKAPGQISLTASASGLNGSTITINAIPSKTGIDSLVSKKKVSADAKPPIPATSQYNPKLPTLFLIGDSTVKNGSGRGDGGLWGWGHALADFFDKIKINVANRALGGRSSRTYLTEGLWDKVLADMKPGDFVMIQFGHNDGGPLDTGRARGSLKGSGGESEEVSIEATGQKEVVHTYGWYIRKYITDAKAKGATPIVVSPIPRNIWKDGKVIRASNDYAKWAAEAAKAEGAYFIDLNEIVAKHYELEGPDKVQEKYFTTTDHTHTTQAGARLNAECVVEGLKEMKACPLGKYLALAGETASYKFDFGSGEVKPGYIQILPTTVYSQELGYGFDLGSTPSAVDRGGTDALRRDYCTGDQPFFFSVALPEGTYKVDVTLGDQCAATNTTVKAESRRLLLERIITEPGKFATRTFTVHIHTPNIAADGEVKLKPREKGPPLVLHWDDKLTLEFNGPRPGVCALEITKANDVVTVYLAGDSTVTDQPFEPWNSWGQMLTRFFKPEVAIANYAESGESLKSFIGEKRLDKILSTIKPGDYLFIQFGHNDQKDKGPDAGAFNSYKKNLQLMSAEARKRGAIPVLITSMHRLSFDEKGKIKNTLGDFPEAVLQTAKEENTPLIDLNEMSKTFYESLGPKDAKKAFQDDTHHNNYGSYELAKCIVEGIKANKLEIAKYIVDEYQAFDPAKPDPIENFAVPASPRNTLR